LKKLDLGQTVSVLANIGVIGGILLLAFELGQNNELLRDEADYNYFQNRGGGRNLIVTDPEFAALQFKIASDEPLTPVERFRLDKLIERTFLAWQWEYGQVVDGNLREDSAETAERWRIALTRDA